MREGIDCHQIRWVERKLYAHSPEYTNQVFGYLTALFPAKETQHQAGSVSANVGTNYS